MALAKERKMEQLVEYFAQNHDKLLYALAGIILVVELTVLGLGGPLLFIGIAVYWKKDSEGIWRFLRLRESYLLVRETSDGDIGRRSSCH